MRHIASWPHVARDWLIGDEPAAGDVTHGAPHRPRVLFFACVVSYFLYLAAMQPGLVLGGEMWAEAGTNYFPTASAPSLVMRFLSTDAGYIPLPQRILAYVGYALDLPARSMPYFYNWSAILITAAMIASFCLAPFRTLVRNDFLRLCTVVAVLLVADFQTRTFINFSYFATFFIAIVAALAFVQRRTEVPRWAWSIPVLMISKPAVLAALPAMIVTAAVGKRRFRLITLAATLTGLAQVAQMAIIYPRSFFVWREYSTAQKVLASIEYFFGFLGSFFLGRGDGQASLHPSWCIGLGVALVCICAVTIARRRNRGAALVLVGLSLVYFNVLLNSFALSAKWNVDNMSLIVVEPLWRYDIAVYFGVVLVVLGLVVAVAEPAVCRRAWHRAIGPVVFLCWFLGSGWAAASRTLNTAPVFPEVGSSQWQAMADVIDSGQPVCVPVDPLEMMFERNCRQLNALVGGYGWPRVFAFDNLQTQDGVSAITLEPPPPTRGGRLISLALVLKPQGSLTVALHAQAALNLRDGTVRYLTGFRELPPSGGLVMVAGEGATPVDDIQSVRFELSAPVALGHTENWQGLARVPVVFWMGN